MREIKFRAWDKKNKEMVNDIWIAPEYSWSVMSDNDAMCERERPERGQWELMQFIGLKDSKGKEIYEGDIVKGIDGWEDNKGRDSNNYLPKIYSVKWEGSELVPMSQDGEYLHFKSYWWEVIGNIYENPELLKVLK